MQAGFVPAFPRMLDYLTWGGGRGLTLGWFIVLLSVPYNIACFIGGYFVTDFGQKVLKDKF